MNSETKSQTVLDRRGSGVLLHPTSLPSAHGIGDLGASARRFIDYLADARQTYWQVLPLNPVGYGNSPYACTSAFAGNPWLIDALGVIQELPAERREHCLDDFADPPQFPVGRVDFERVGEWKLPRLRRLATEFIRHADDSRRSDYQAFCQRHTEWLDDYALFVCIKRHFDRVCLEAGHEDSSWNIAWDADIAARDPQAIARWREQCRDDIEIEKVLQHFFFSQWKGLEQYAHDRSVHLVGDVPIFVAMDSADVWTSPDQFQLDAQLQPIVVAGVPPDYFSETGQRWGNPLYDWDTMREDGFQWWIRRFDSLLEWVDVIRLDHFRGFEAYWSISAEQPTAEHGQWIKAPGEELFDVILSTPRPGPETGVPIIAEDLGVITAEVETLRDQFGFPGMRILQFAFDPQETRSSHFLPESYDANTVVYTGTHDNETVLGWYEHQPDDVRQRVEECLSDNGDTDLEIAWRFIWTALASSANTVILPMQDILNLDNEARFNCPGTVEDHWSWQLAEDWLDGDQSAGRLADWVKRTDRLPVEMTRLQQND